jgi:hypothetical protein
VCELSKKWRRANPELKREADNRWRQANPERTVNVKEMVEKLNVAVDKIIRIL